MPRVLFGLVEVVMVLLFVLSARFAYQTRGRTGVLELLSAVPFGLLLEQGDIAIFGSYAYNPQFFLRIGSVPLAIALAWAMIITSSMFMSDRLGIPAHWAPFSDAVFAILLDLSLDAVAIRQGLWHWNIPLNTGFFGVPAGNYYGWLFVAFGFSLWTRRLRANRRRDHWRWLQLLVGIPAYVTLLLALVPFIVLQQLFFGGPTGGFPPFLITLALFGGITGLCLRHSSAPLPAPWKIPLLPRLLIHGYFIGAGIILQIFVHVPVLFAVSLTMLLLELAIGRRVTPAVWDDVPRPARSKPNAEEHKHHEMDDRSDPQPGGVFNPSYVLPSPRSHGRDRRTGRGR